MPNYVLVPDPLYKGEPPAPKMIRSWAMRKLYDAGMPIADIARRYDVPYARAYKSIHYHQTEGLAPTTSRPAPRVRKVKTLEEMSMKELKRIATTSADQNLITKAAAILDTRDATWYDKL